RFTNCYAEGNDLDGFTVADSPTAPPSDRNHFVNCHAKNNLLFGMGIAADECTVIGGEYDFNGQDGIRLVYSNNQVIGATVKSNGQSVANTYHGIAITGDNNIV